MSKPALIDIYFKCWLIFGDSVMGKFKKIFAPLVAIAIAMLAFVEPAMAQTAVDATVATGQITEGETAATTVGQAIIGFAALVMVFRWVKAQFF